jgi:CRP-like cAMP-binding protein
MTQELIANMLGVRRGGVTDAAIKLQEAGLIRYSRGPHLGAGPPRPGAAVLRVLCVVKKEYDRLLVSGYVSMLAAVDGTPALEVGMVGSEGMVGAHVALGVTTVSGQALVQGSGTAMRAPVQAFQAVLDEAPALRSCLGRYLYVRMEQLAGIAPCLRFHVIEKRLARWLLMTHDRSQDSAFMVKQEFLSYMLGVRRAGITEAAMSLQSLGLISYSRGTMTVLDRAGLEAEACACYVADRASYAKQLGEPHRHDPPPVPPAT